MRRVVKFDGSSLAGARQFKEVAGIVKSGKSRRYAVPSTPGKRSDKDKKVTDLLYACYDTVMKGRSYREILEKVKSKYIGIVDGLDLNPNLNHEFDRIEENFPIKAGRDYAASREKYLNGITTANFLKFEFVGVTEDIFFGENEDFESEHINRELSEHLEHVEKVVISGFYSSRPDGTIKVFSGGGSDITSSTAARTIHVGMYENWTDVPGVLVTDPRIVENPEIIRTIIYRELRELSYMGISVLHENATLPVRKEGISINIRNTSRPEDKGTLVVESTRRKPRYTITGVAGKKGFYSISMEKVMMNAGVRFRRKALSVFGQCDTSFGHIPSSIDTITACVYQSESKGFEQSIVAGIRGAMEPDTVELESDLVLIAVVGRGMRFTGGTIGRISSALAHAGVNVKMIDQSSSEWSIIIEVKNGDFGMTIRATYSVFITTEL